MLARVSISLLSELILKPLASPAKPPYTNEVTPYMLYCTPCLCHSYFSDFKGGRERKEQNNVEEEEEEEEEEQQQQQQEEQEQQQEEQ